MSSSRADLITQNQRKLENFSDFHNNMVRHPVSNQLIILHNEDAVRQAFKNLIYTNVFERYFNPFFGTNIRKSMFDLETLFLIEDITSAVRLSARQFEPRINIINVTVTGNDPTEPRVHEPNEIKVNVVFHLVNNPRLIELPLVIKRVR